MQRKIRVLVGKPGLDGHDRGAKVVAAALRDDGMEVIYTGLHQTPEQIVEAATQEDVDVVALSILSGAHMTLFPDVLQLMRERGLGDRLLTGGGIIPPEDMETLARSGVGKLFGPGASTQDIAKYIRGWFEQTHEANGVSAALPSPKPAGKTAPAKPATKSAAVAKPATKRKAAKVARAAAKPARRTAKARRPATSARARRPAKFAAKGRSTSKPARKRR
jgi:methylmalonyl-CoA mutase C-terminal domain/subunit